MAQSLEVTLTRDIEDTDDALKLLDRGAKEARALVRLLETGSK